MSSPADIRSIKKRRPSTKRANFPRLVRAAWERLFGYDFFISYAWRDGRSYAEALYSRLTSPQHRYRCFIDDKEMGGGQEWRAAVNRALLKSSVMLLVATPGAFESENVSQELEAFSKRKNPLIPIDFDATVEALPRAHHLYSTLEGRLRVSEGDGILGSGNLEPSDVVIDFVDSSFGFVRIARLRSIVLSLALVFFIGLAGIATYYFLAEREQLLQTKQAIIMAGAIGGTDPLVSALLLQELGHDSVPRGAAAVANRIIENGVPHSALRGHTSSVLRIIPSPNSADLSASISAGDAKLWNGAGPGSVADLMRGPIEDLSFQPRGNAAALAVDGQGVVFRPTLIESSAIVLKTPQDSAQRVLFSGDGSALVATGYTVPDRVKQGWIRLWRLNNGLPAEVNLGETTSLDIGDVKCFNVSRNGNVVVAAGILGGVAVFQPGTSHPMTLMENGHCADVTSDGTRIAVTRDTNVYVHEVAQLSQSFLVGRLGSHEKYIQTVAFSLDGKWLATGSDDRSVMVYEVANPDRIHRYVEHQWSVESVAFDPSAQWVLSRAAGVVKVSHRDNNRVEFTLRGPWATDARFSADGKKILVSAQDGTIRVWDVPPYSTDAVMSGHEADLIVFLLNPDQHALLTGASGENARVWDLDRFGEQSTLQPNQPIRAASIAKSGGVYVTGDEAGTVRKWRFGNREGTVIGQCGTPVIDIATDAIGRSVVVACLNGEVLWWEDVNKPDAKRIAITKPWRVAMTEDGGHFAVATQSDLQIWSTSASEVRLVRKVPGWFSSIATMPNGHWVAAAKQNDVYVLDWINGAEKLLAGHTDWIRKVRFSANGQLMATGSTDGSVRVWRTASWSEHSVLSAHSLAVDDVAFNQSGERIVSASDDGTVRVWYSDGIGEPAVLNGERGMRAASFAANDEFVVAGSAKGHFYKWPVGWSLLAQRLSKLTDACLMPADRVALLGEDVESAMQIYRKCERSFGRSGDVPLQVKAGP
jgi:WD40 repeat protein